MGRGVTDGEAAHDPKSPALVATYLAAATALSRSGAGAEIVANLVGVNLDSDRERIDPPAPG